MKFNVYQINVQGIVYNVQVNLIYVYLKFVVKIEKIFPFVIVFKGISKTRINNAQVIMIIVINFI